MLASARSPRIHVRESAQIQRKIWDITFPLFCHRTHECREEEKQPSGGKVSKVTTPIKLTDVVPPGWRQRHEATLK